ncbi:ABC transporter permease [Brevibacillus laterosporus]|uniref:ABC transporter permease n=2 Tax=Brevibacillus laterosporus TaxID=1465 RepID=UPI00345503DB
MGYGLSGTDMAVMQRKRGQKITQKVAKKNRHIGWGFASVCTFLLLWEAGCRLLELPAFILPPPSLIAVALWELRNQLLTTHLWITLQEALLGLVISIFVGTGIAICMHLNEKMKKIMYPHVIISQTIPILALSPVFMMWFGYELPGKIAIAVLFTFFPIVVSTYDGFLVTDAQRRNYFRMIGASRWQIFCKLEVPSALPSFFSGVKVAATFSVSGATVGEWLGASAGLGFFGRRASGNFQAPALFASVLLLCLLGLGLFLVMTLVEQRCLSYNRKEKDLRQ